MELLAKLLLGILGLTAIVVFIERLEFADYLYQASRGLPQPLPDIFAFAVIGIIIVVAAKTLKRE